MTRMRFDFAVIGAGPAGSAAAHILAAAGCRVLLVDQTAPDQFKIGESLIPAARNLLGDLGLLDRFLADGHLPSHGHASTWGSTRVHSVDFIRSPHGNGWHLDRARFDALLRSMAVDSGAVSRFSTQLVDFERTASGDWALALRGAQGDERVECQWLLDGTGRSHLIARHLGIPRRYADRLIAFYARFRPQNGHTDTDSLSFVEAVPEGWWYTARLPSNQRIVMFVTDADAPPARPARTQAGFSALLAQTHHLQGKLAPSSHAITEKPRGADARSARLERFHGEGWLALGDAALSFDPLSSQGIYTALYGGIKAAKALLEWHSGDRTALERYDTALTSVYTHFLINRHTYYQYERRWPDNTFWRRRLEQASRSTTISGQRSDNSQSLSVPAGSPVASKDIL